MADRFVLTAEIQLRAPTNTAQIRDEMQRQLNGVTIPITVKGAAQSARSVSQVEKKVNSLTTASERMGNSFGLSLKRFAAFSIANRAVGLFTSKTAAAIDEAIDFETELIKVVQVTGKTKKELAGLTDTITKLSTALVGTSSKGLLSTARILSQAGIAAGELDVALTALAKTTLAPTFDDIEQTAEGAVAVLAQFGEGVGALERQLGAVNAVAGQFAVESGDLISAVRRTGGVFKSAGGDLNELLALFTSVRATTRESAESIATGMRTIFTRIQRPQTIEYMKQFGVELTDLEGRFVGPFEAVRQLSGALSSFDEGDIRFVKIAEELGGFRQIGKVLPLIQKFEIAEKARQAALDGGNSLTEDTIVAQQGLAVQFTKVREEFLALARSMTETGAFRTMVQTLLSLSSSLIQLSESFKPILPILGALAGIKIARGLGGFAAGLGSGLARKSEGGPIGFATGGLVPGKGSGDTVPAMLTPGEFVMKKSSVESLGVENLSRLNKGGPVQRYAGAGLVIPSFIDPDQRGSSGKVNGMTLRDAVDNANSNSVGRLKPAAISSGFSANIVEQLKLAGAAQAAKGVVIAPEPAKPKDGSKSVIRYKTNPGAIGGFFLNPAKGDDARRKITKDKKFNITTGEYAGHPGKLLKGSTLQGFTPAVKDMKDTPSLSQSVELAVSEAMENGMLSLVPSFDKHVSVGAFNGKEAAISAAAKKVGKDPNVVNTTTGFMFEGIIQALTGAQFSGNKANFDFNEESLKVNRSRLSELFGSSKVSDLVKADAKKNATAGNDIFKKVVNDLKVGNESGVTRLAAGGVASSDTVDALLTPGEFVIKKDVAERVGYGNLNRMNRTGVQGFAKGGVVGPQKFADGGEVSGGGGKALAGLFALQAIPGIIQNMVKSEGEQTTAVERVVNSITDMISKVAAVSFALQAFGISLNKATLTKGLDFARGKSGASVKDRVADFGEKLSNTGFKGGLNFAGMNKLPGAKAGLARGAGALVSGAAGAAGTLAAVAGPALAIGLAFKGVSSILTAYQDNLGKYNDAIKDGNVAKAQELAIAKNNSGISNLFGAEGIEQGIREMFGGETSGELLAVAKASALAAKFQNDFADNAKSAAKVMEDIKAGRTTASEALKEGGVSKNFAASAKALEAKRAAAATKTGERDDTGVFSRLTRDILTLGGTIGENSAEKDRRVKGESEKLISEGKVANDKEFESLKPVFRALTKEVVFANGGLATFNKTLLDNGIELTSAQARELAKDFKDQSTAIRENLAHIQSLNFGLSQVISSAQFTAGAMANVANASEVGSNSIENEMFLIKSSLSNFSSVMSDTDIATARAGVQSSFKDSGVDAGLTKETLGNFDFISSLGKKGLEAFEALKKAQDNGLTNPSAMKEFFIEQLGKGDKVTDENRKRLNDASSKIDFSSPEMATAIANGDASIVTDTVQAELGKKLAEELLAIKKAELDQENVLIGLAKQRIALQATELNAIQESVKIRLESANNIAEFDGSRVSASKKNALLTTGVNASLGAAGVSQLGVGPNGPAPISPAEIVKRFKELDVANAPVFGPPIDIQDSEGLNNDRLDEINRANKDLLQYTRDRIGVVRDELELARKKTALERSSVEKLLDGDFEGFFEGQQTADAAKALAAGDSGAASQFTPKQLGEAFRSLRDQGLESGKLAEAARIALGPFADQRNVDLLVGTTDEEKPLIEEGKALSKAMLEAANNMTEFAKRDIEIKDATIKATNVVFAKGKETTKRVTEEAQKPRQEAKIKVNAEEEKLAKAEKDQRILDAERRSSNATRGVAASVGNTQTDYSKPFDDNYLDDREARGIDSRMKEEKIKEEQARIRKDIESNPMVRDRMDYSAGYGAFANGGMVYANNGMFVPRGTDTVPAMLTPGEFVVNRRSVQRGNNLQLLQAMNGGDGVSYGRGGVSYRHDGGLETGSNASSPSVSIDTSALITSLNNSFNNFQASVDQLSKIKVQIAFDTTNVNVTLTETSFVASMKEDVKNEIMDMVITKIRSLKHSSNGTHTVD
jgi:hypothetical protein